ncbi:DUF1905 domain-containing protein [Chryseosolibacter indicus]|uniref:DUF1905 domain-containing protein n=1 Tax=Chryseosolibacter indicus TaxID=2782351 RepID=A0ABS5VN96_9BACT|nr:YdeI/OmpD-associated family protein [Chryseosolibacter indicus]MBT1702229.1 DUF1905 domain-containing protein [Chryseosolibacter indicus]
MVIFSTKINQFDKQGEKSGWMYIKITKQQAEKLKPGNRIGFRVKGRLDEYPIKQTALLPMGDGSFIIPFNASMRKSTSKKAGDIIKVQIEADERPLKISKDLLDCLKDDPLAAQYFKTLTKSHQQYISKWIESAKTSNTKTKRLTVALMVLSKQQGYTDMMKMNREID